MKTRASFIPVLAAAFLSSCPAASAAEPVPGSDELPRVPPTPAPQAAAKFELKDGYEIQLVAAEPQVADPIAIVFDEDGRAFVIEMHGYPEKRAGNLGRVRLLEDADGEGRFDKHSVYADGLSWPSAIFPWDGGVFVGAVPDLWYFKDTDGDGKADLKKKLFTGFIAGPKERDIAPRCFNSMTWGPDNRIHVASSMNGGLVRPADDPTAEPLDLRRRDFSFDPRKLDLRPETGTGQYGLTFNARGRKFVCKNSNHIQALMYEERYVGLNRHYSLPAAKVDIGVDGPAAEVFRISGDEPWRILRMRWRIEGTYAGGVEKGGKVSGYFTSACGITIYNGDAMPELIDNAFIAAPANNIVHRKRIREEGVALVAERPADERDREFLASRDQWFRPVKFANAPDGALYVVDMYREIIEVAHAIPDSIKERVDVYSGTDRGRIWRIAPKGFQRRPKPRLGEMSPEELVRTLAHPNGWHRETAARLLLERDARSVVPQLSDLSANSDSPAGRLRALGVLDSFGAITTGQILNALSDSSPALRERAIVLAEPRFADMLVKDRQAIETRLKELSAASDTDSFVRFRIALAMGKLRPFSQGEILTNIISHDPDSEWMRHAVLNSLNYDGYVGQCFRAVAPDSDPAFNEFRRQLTRLIGVINSHPEVENVLRFVAGSTNAAVAFETAAALADGLRQADSSLERVDGQGRIAALFAKARESVVDRAAGAADRIAATRLLGWAKSEAAMEALLPLLDGREPQALQLAALDSLARFSEARIGEALVDKWPTLTPRLRSETIRTLLRRSTFTHALLDGLREGVIRRADLSSTQIRFLRNHRSKNVRAAALRTLESPPVRQRAEIIDSFRPALELKGNVRRGSAVFLERCASCHKLNDLGHNVGPDLATIKNAGREELLTHIIDPNREVDPNYVNYTVELKDGESALGIVVSESADSVTLKQPFGVETVIRRADMLSMKSDGKSAMPEGLELELSHERMADLIEYLLQTRER